jgi:DNA primase
LGGSSVLVVESVLSILRAETLATSGTIAHTTTTKVLTNATSTFGAKVSDTQLRLLRNYDKVVLWFDDDIAGLRATLKVCKALDNFTHVYVVQNQGARDDLAGLTEGEIESSLDGIEPSVLVLSQIEDRLKQMEIDLQKEKELSW